MHFSPYVILQALEEKSSQKKKFDEELLVLRKHREELELALQKCQEDLSATEEQLKVKLTILCQV